MTRTARRALPILLAAGVLAGEALAQERVLLRRYADVVAVRERPDGPEEVLYYFDPTRELPQGAQVQQGSSGYTELLLSGGGVLATHASAHIVLEQLGPGGDVVRFPLLTLLEVSGGTRRLDLSLPGGTRCSLLESNLLIEVLPGRLRIRNQKGEPVAVTGLVGVDPAPQAATDPEQPGRGRVLLTAGQEIQIPMYSGDQPEGGLIAKRWLGRLVRHGPGAVVTSGGTRLAVGREAQGELHATANVEIGGVATMPGSGHLVVHDPRPMAPPTPPPEAGTPAPAPAGLLPEAPSEPPPEPLPEPSPDDLPEEDSP